MGRRATDTMLAAVRDRYGPPEVVEVREVERPEPVGDELLVRVQAASINRVELDFLYARPGFVRLFTGVRRPRTRRVGCDVAGVVEAVGPQASRFRPGDRVFGDMYSFGHGSFAEFKLAPERAFLPIPDEMPVEVAATLPHGAVLAVQALRLPDGRTVGPGDRVLVDGASGSVGPFAVQIAKALGAEVTGVCSAAKADFVRSLGADHVIDYRTTDVTLGPERYDWVVDVEIRQSLLAWRRAVARGGVYVTLGGSAIGILSVIAAGPLVSRATGRRMAMLLWWRPFAADDVATLARLIAEGSVTPTIDRRFPLREAVAALRYVDDGHARGKVLIVP